MSKTWPCKHIRGKVYFASVPKCSIFNINIPVDWNFCPICGAKRPPNKPKKRKNV